MRDRDIIEWLGRVEKKVDHNHLILHEIAEGIAGIEWHLANPSGMSSEETAAVTARLKAHAAKLEGITKPPQT